MGAGPVGGGESFWGSKREEGKLLTVGGSGLEGCKKKLSS